MSAMEQASEALRAQLRAEKLRKLADEYALKALADPGRPGYLEGVADGLGIAAEVVRAEAE